MRNTLRVSFDKASMAPPRNTMPVSHPVTIHNSPSVT